MDAHQANITDEDDTVLEKRSFSSGYFGENTGMSYCGELTSTQQRRILLNLV